MKNNLDLLKIIEDNFLCVRRLPFEVVSLMTYNEGDENIVYKSSNGEPKYEKTEVITQMFDLEYFENTKPQKGDDRTPQQKFEYYKNILPNGRKLLKCTRKVSEGGWWYVKQVRDTGSIVQFNRKDNKCFFAPTLEEAIKLYLES